MIALLLYRATSVGVPPTPEPKRSAKLGSLNGVSGGRHAERVEQSPHALFDVVADRSDGGDGSAGGIVGAHVRSDSESVSDTTYF